MLFSDNPGARFSLYFYLLRYGKTIDFNQEHRKSFYQQPDYFILSDQHVFRLVNNFYINFTFD